MTHTYETQAGHGQGRQTAQAGSDGRCAYSRNTHKSRSHNCAHAPWLRQI